MAECIHCRRTQRDDEEKKKLIVHLKRIEGQVRGVREMVEDDRYCIDIINQVSAINASLLSLSRNILDKHLRTCVKEGILAGDDEKFDEITDILKRVMR